MFWSGYYTKAVVSTAGIVVDTRLVDESPRIRLTTPGYGCSVMLNRPVRTRMPGGVGGGIREDSPYPD